MAKEYGTARVEQIDVISTRDGKCYLHLIQSDQVDQDKLLLLQEKLNNYLTYILDGQLASERPELANLYKTVQIDLQFAPNEIEKEFFEKVRSIFESEGIASAKISDRVRSIILEKVRYNNIKRLPEKDPRVCRRAREVSKNVSSSSYQGNIRKKMAQKELH